MDAQLEKAALTAVRDCLGVQKGETLLVVTDTKLRPIGEALVEAGRGLGAVAAIMEMQPLSRNGEEPPAMVAEAMKHAAAVICPTATSLTHTAARREACAAGARVATMPGITRETMIRALGADYHAIAERTRRLTALLDTAGEARVTAALGTDITLPIEGIRAISSTGLILEPGSFGNLPSGESYMMPEEGKSRGVFVVDGSMAGIGDLAGAAPITIRVEGGYAVEISGGPEADLLRAKLEPLGKAAFNIAELGIGTNDSARIIGVILEDEKVMGTVHIALGNNMSMGGTIDVPIHLDGVIKDPTLELDGKTVMKEGKLLI